MEQEFLLQNYARYPLVLDRGQGCYVYDVEGNRYLDFIAGIGVNALGHAHPRILKVITEQAGLLTDSLRELFTGADADVPRRLRELGWDDVVAEDPALATTLLFAEKGRALSRASLLDDAVLPGLAAGVPGAA